MTIKDMRVISEDLFVELIKIMTDDPKVAAYQKLILSKKIEEKEEEKKEHELQ